jgi:hypothetical protein
MKIILVCLNNFQDYILNNIQNLFIFNNLQVIIITNKVFFDKFKNLKVELIDCDDLDDVNYNLKSNIDKQFRNGFWHLCSLRLFYLYSYIKKFNLENIIHIENDVLIYENMEKIKDKFTENKIYATFDSDDRIIPGILFIPNYQIFEPIITNYNFNLNDMQNLALFDEKTILPLPIFINNNHKITKLFNKFNCIFDAAAIGQYLGGVDSRNISDDTRGFINETCLIKYNNYKFYWIINDLGLYQPYILINNNYIQIINLHIHSKNLCRFMGNDPKETKYIIIHNICKKIMNE